MAQVLNIASRKKKESRKAAKTIMNFFLLISFLIGKLATKSRWKDRDSVKVSCIVCLVHTNIKPVINILHLYNRVLQNGPQIIIQLVLNEAFNLWCNQWYE